MDTIESVIEFASSFDLDFPSSIEGSPEPAIQALEQALDRPCLTLLRAIPEEDGPSTGTIQLGPCSTRPDELLRFRADSLHALPEGFELQAMPVLDDEGDIFLVAQGHEPRVAVAHLPVTASEPFVPEQANVIPSSLAELLCLPVLSTVHALALLPHRAAFVAEQLDPPHLVHARQLADDLQLEPHW
eukprot:CAMPEP_0185848862 /NCGR_PEP_ID=MMETSP1354-20130828/3580_1 /TAXON_ID=708628 /ORGANISM="Erythrolobus madagascarensis, Strain CCMP3276" /LENGTH=186 /DNA_ID=CAMNT_0028549315 /DNA_START=105 /DNA_END=663 /DNA_ORIENTATION=+